MSFPYGTTGLEENPGAVLDPDDLRIDYDLTRVHGRWVVVTVIGEVTAGNARQLEHAVDLPASTYARIALDLRSVPLCDADGVITLLKIKARAHRAGQDLRLVNLSGSVRKVLEISGVDDLLFGSSASSPAPQARAVAQETSSSASRR